MIRFHSVGHGGYPVPSRRSFGKPGERGVGIRKQLCDRLRRRNPCRIQTLNEFGLAVRSERIKFNYLVAIQEMKPGVFGRPGIPQTAALRTKVFPEHVATLGTVAMVFVFHPNYAGGFRFPVRGAAPIRAINKPGQIHFRKKPNALRAFGATGWELNIFA